MSINKEKRTLEFFQPGNYSQNLPATSAPFSRTPATPLDHEALGSGQHREMQGQLPSAISVSRQQPIRLSSGRSTRRQELGRNKANLQYHSQAMRPGVGSRPHIHACVGILIRFFHGDGCCREHVGVTASPGPESLLLLSRPSQLSNLASHQISMRPGKTSVIRFLGLLSP